MATDAHARTSAQMPEPLYDLEVATPSHAERALTMGAAQKTGTLCTLYAPATPNEQAGHPYGSFVTVSLQDGSPIFLLSELAEHTKNLRSDPRASLMLAEDGADDPLANARVTLLGPCLPVADPGGSARDAFLSRHPNAEYYADFKDFHFWKLQVESVRYIGGYGRMSWVDAADWLAAEPDPLAASAAGIISHMNADHAETLVSYCKAFSRAPELGVEFSSVQMTGVDRYGFEMSAQTAEGPRPVRLAFPEEVSSADGTRKALIALLKDARAYLAK